MRGSRGRYAPRRVWPSVPRGAEFRLTLKGDRVIGEEWLLQDLKQRIRDVRVGPDGAVYVATDDSDGKVLKLVPKG